MKRLLFPLLPLLAAAASPSDPYQTLREANRTHDPALAVSAYAGDALLVFEYPGRPREVYRGHSQILQSYRRYFDSIDRDRPVELDFRFEPPGLRGDAHEGVYRIIASVGGKPVTAYGRFSARLRMEGGTWRFAEDRGSKATAADFEALEENPPG